MTDLKTITSALDEELHLADFEDDSHNGLQVANTGLVAKVCCGVDASLDFLKAAKDLGANFCVVHHGISWGSSLAKITAANYEIVSFLIQNDMALYAAHLPLDAHPLLGNNACIAAALGMTNVNGFCLYHGNCIGRKGSLATPLTFDDLCGRVRTLTPGGTFHALPFGKHEVKTLGIVSGGAANDVCQAIDEGLDCYLTGEMNLQAYNAAKQGGINVIAAGHYATERFGVRAVGDYLSRNFKLSCDFVNFDLPW